MNTMLSQLKQWPPTGSTVIGGGMMIGLVIYMVTGSIEGAVAIAGLFKMLCPQDAGATDQVLDALRRVTVRPVAVLLACAVLAGLAACSATQVASGEKRVAAFAQKVQPALLPACDTAMMLAPLSGPLAPWIIGGCGTVEAIDKLAADPSSTAWVNGLIVKASSA